MGKVEIENTQKDLLIKKFKKTGQVKIKITYYEIPYTQAYLPRSGRTMVK